MSRLEISDPKKEIFVALVENKGDPKKTKMEKGELILGKMSAIDKRPRLNTTSASLCLFPQAPRPRIYTNSWLYVFSPKTRNPQAKGLGFRENSPAHTHTHTPNVMLNPDR